MHYRGRLTGMQERQAGRQAGRQADRQAHSATTGYGRFIPGGEVIGHTRSRSLRRDARKKFNTVL